MDKAPQTMRCNAFSEASDYHIKLNKQTKKHNNLMAIEHKAQPDPHVRRIGFKEA